MQPLRRPPDDCSDEEWAAYRKERVRRKIIKRERRARIARRESPHDAKTCAICLRSPRKLQYDVRVRDVAERSMVSRHHVYRVFSDNIKQARGRKTLATLRRIAHDGMGISLDELAAMVLD
jgi:transcriptional regulator with XRE-family HTH domain